MEAAVGMGHAGRQIIHQDAVLQVAVADAHAVEALILHDGLEDGGTGHDDVGPVGIDAGHAAAFLEGAAAQFLDGPAQAAVAEHVAGFLRGPARAGGVLGIQGGGDLGQVLGRAGAGHGLLDDEVRYALERAQGIVADIGLQGGVALGGDGAGVLVEKEVGQAHAAHLEGVEVAVILGIAHHQLGAAAADVDEQAQALGMGQAAGDAQIDEAGLFAAGDHAEVDAGLFPDTAHEVRAVDRVAHGGRGDGDDLRGGVDGAHLGHAAQDVDGPGHALFTQVARLEGAFAQAHHVLDLVEDRMRAVGQDAHQHQAQRVAAQVDDADDAFPLRPFVVRHYRMGHTHSSSTPKMCMNRSPLTSRRSCSGAQSRAPLRVSTTLPGCRSTATSCTASMWR